MMASAFVVPPLDAAVLFLTMTFLSFFWMTVPDEPVRGSACAG
jgi:hypothetical protein